jgi:hypothetical protein
MLGHDVAFSTYLQYEQWRFPALRPNREANLTAALELTFYTHWHLTEPSSQK